MYKGKRSWFLQFALKWVSKNKVCVCVQSKNMTKMAVLLLFSFFENKFFEIEKILNNSKSPIKKNKKY